MTKPGAAARSLPDREVLEAFGVIGGAVQVLDGGAETSVRVGSTVFKRVDDVVVADWSQRVLAALDPSAWRAPLPLAAVDGRWVVNGWTATAFIDGLRPFTEQPAVVIDVGLDLSEQLTDHMTTGVEAIGRRTDRWAIADRVAWGEQAPDSFGLHTEVLELLRRLRAHQDDRTESPNIVHGDLASNVFVDPSGTPTVLDLSPYVRPARFGSAIVVVDHLLWFGGAPTLRQLADDDSLARALTFRVVAHQLALAVGEDHGLAEITPIVERLGL